MSFALKITSRALPLPMRRDSCAMGPPPGTRRAPTSNCDKMAFSRLAKRMSQAGQAHFPYQSPARESTLSIRQVRDSGASASRAMDATLWVQEEDAPNRQVLQENPNESE